MFGKSAKAKKSEDTAGRETAVRHSRGWKDILDHLRNNESLRVLDFGSTSPANITYFTSLGHSVYMANIVQDAARQEYWKVKSDAPAGSKADFDVDMFLENGCDFSRRDFDVVLLWDTADFLPPALVPQFFDRLSQILKADGRLLAFFHGRAEGEGTEFARYQVSDSDMLTLLGSGQHNMQGTYQTRQIERFLQGYASVRFFLGKDNVREVISVR